MTSIIDRRSHHDPDRRFDTQPGGGPIGNLLKDHGE